MKWVLIIASMTSYSDPKVISFPDEITCRVALVQMLGGKQETHGLYVACAKVTK